MDEVMADAIAKQLELFNRDYRDNVGIEHLQGRKLRDLRPHLTKEISGYFDLPDFFRDLPVIENSIEVIRELSERYEIFIATAAMEVPYSFAAKYEWLQEHFTFIPPSNIVFCGNKSIIHADFLIDDHASNFVGFQGQGVLYTAAHNVFVTGYPRVNNWLEVREFFC
jgi:5'(3')-deoxyribonucleotidase